MPHTLSEDDLRFRDTFEACKMRPSAFTHRAHVRLAYVYLVEQDDETAQASMRDALRAYLRHLNADPAKYHETITSAWVLAVRHFMALSPPCASAAAFIDANPKLLDKTIMRTHYSAEVLFSDEARASFVQPDLSEIPRHTQPLA